ncbi:MAG TPA: hypothetical protein VIA02_03200 [Candidatus Limnocylindria bacterium]|jgi:hypothetical protein
MTRRTQARLLPSLAIASALVLVTAGTALGKCEHDPSECQGMIVTLDPGGTLSAGGTEIVGVFVLEDEQPYDATRVNLTFTSVADGTAIRVAAEPTGSYGRWQAAVELPAGGTWTVSAVVQGAGFAGDFALDPVSVRPPAAAPTTGGTSPIVLATPALGPVLLAALIAGMSGLLLMTRKRQVPAAS